MWTRYLIYSDLMYFMWCFSPRVHQCLRRSIRISLLHLNLKCRSRIHNIVSMPSCTALRCACNATHTFQDAYYSVAELCVALLGTSIFLVESELVTFSEIDLDFSRGCCCLHVISDCIKMFSDLSDFEITSARCFSFQQIYWGWSVNEVETFW